MKIVNKHTKSASKGDRLNWTPLKHVKLVPITKQLTKGKKLSSTELSKENSKLLVP